MKWRNGWLVVLAVLLLAVPTAVLAQQKTLKYAHFQPAKDDQPKHVAALAFKEHVEKATSGSVKVEIFPAGQFGNDADTMSGGDDNDAMSGGNGADEAEGEPGGGGGVACAGGGSAGNVAVG